MSDVFWSMIVLMSLAGWIGAAIAFIFKSFTGRGRFEPRPARIWGVIFVVAYALWIVGMLNA